jgi:hypothetical protein
LKENHLFTGFLNPLYLPQLIFRTPVAMMMAGTVALMISGLCAEEKQQMEK